MLFRANIVFFKSITSFSINQQFQFLLFYFRVSGLEGAKRSRRERAEIREPVNTRLRAKTRKYFFKNFERGGTPDSFIKIVNLKNLIF